MQREEHKTEQQMRQALREGFRIARTLDGDWLVLNNAQAGEQSIVLAAPGNYKQLASWIRRNLAEVHLEDLRDRR